MSEKFIAMSAGIGNHNLPFNDCAVVVPYIKKLAYAKSLMGSILRMTNAFYNVKYNNKDLVRLSFKDNMNTRYYATKAPHHCMSYFDDGVQEFVDRIRIYDSNVIDAAIPSNAIVRDRMIHIIQGLKIQWSATFNNSNIITAEYLLHDFLKLVKEV